MRLRIEEIIYSVLVVIVMGFLAWAMAYGLWLGFGPSKDERERSHAMQVIQEVDGCKVYRFYDGDYHYITRCGDKVTTQKNWDEYCGKACRRHRTEDITTEGNQ
jgi:hypothetical protein